MAAELRMDPHDESSARNFFLIDTTSADAVARASVPLVRRGFDPIEVQGFARAVSSELGRLHQEIGDLRTALGESERRAAVGIDEDVVLEFLGEESARMLADARSTAQQVRARAEDHATRTVAAAESDAHSIRAEAQTYSADVHKAADQRAKDSAAEADRNARSLVTSAKRESDQLISDAEQRAAALIAATEATAAAMIAAAEQERDDVLHDLAVRRADLMAQIDRQLASRAALHEMVSRVRLLADDSLEELDAIGVSTEPFAPALDLLGQVTLAQRS